MIAGPTTRAERQSRNFNAPIVPKARLTAPEDLANPEKIAKTVVKKIAKSEAVAVKAPAAKPKAAARKDKLSAAKAKAAKEKSTRYFKTKKKVQPAKTQSQAGGPGEGKAENPKQDRQAPRQRQQKATQMSNLFSNAHRIVVKVGSALLVDGATGELRRDWLTSLCADVAVLKKEGRQVILVSSGSIALGRRALGLKAGALRLEESQAAAAVGQVRLAEAYADIFAGIGIVAAQILLTLGDTEERDRYLNARATLGTLLEFGAVPVINENDTVATAEIRFGDNDRLGARVASMLGADLLVLLSDVDGLYTADPSRDAAAVHIPDVAAITPEIEAMAGVSISGVGRGGMVSKLIAAKIATGAGSNVIITKGESLNPLQKLRGQARHTIFRASISPATARKRWIAGVLKPMGSLMIDEGAARALGEGKSLLPAGIRQIDGRFERGDVVLVTARDGREIARGLVAYNASDAERIAGKRTVEIEAILGYRGRDEMIHRDDLALTPQS